MARKKVDVLATGRFIRLVNEGGWEFADRVQVSGVVAVIATTAAGELVLTEQYRPPIKKKVIDLPAGLAGDIAGQEEESKFTAAERELLEETGYQASTTELIGTCPTSPGMTTEMVDLFLCQHARKVGDGGGDESEAIKVHLVPLKKVHAWLRRKQTSRTCIDFKVYAALGVLAEHAIDS